MRGQRWCAMLSAHSMKTLFALFFCSLCMVARAGQPIVRMFKTISLPGVSGRFDHFSVDLNGHRLFVAALGNDTLEIIDVAAGKSLHTIAGLHKPQGVAFLPGHHQIVVANGGDGTVKFFNGDSYTLEKAVEKLDDADNVRVDSAEKIVYVGYGDGALAAIDASTARHVGDIKLPGHPESFQLEEQGDRIFVNVPNAKQITVLSRKTGSVVATWPMTKFHANFPMALDEENHRLFIGCRRPARLVILDTESGRLIADLEISGDTDDVFYDPKLKLVYISCGAGFIDVISQEDANAYAARERVPSSSGARTAFFSPEREELYLAVPLRGKQIAEIRTYKTE